MLRNNSEASDLWKKVSQILHTEMAELVDPSLTQLVSVLLFLMSVFLPVKVQILIHINNRRLHT